MAKNNAAQASQVAWCNYDLTVKDKARMNELYPDATALETAVQELIGGGHKISIVYDGWAKAFAAYAFPTPDNPLNKGLALSARSRTALGALRGLVFRHAVVFKGNWRASTPGAVLDDE